MAGRFEPVCKRCSNFYSTLCSKCRIYTGENNAPDFCHDTGKVTSNWKNYERNKGKILTTYARSIGIPFKDVGKRLVALSSAIKSCGMDVAADCGVHLHTRVKPNTKTGKMQQIVTHATIDVYFME